LNELALQREPAVARLITDFADCYKKKYGIDLQLIPDLASKLSKVYFGLCYKYVKPFIEDKANRYKMASIMELIIVNKQVLRHPSGQIEEHRRANAIFGQTAALSLINCMISHTDQEFFCNTINESVNVRIRQMLDNHREWLQSKNLEDFPVFLNEQFYEFVDIAVSFPYEMH
jgi:hypothetical protein